jgi:1-acyl-sn-glycerol-3-phosphate acyltransferase
MRHAAKVLKRGLTLGMFPEGKRSKGKGLAVAKTGAARLAIEAECPIVPMIVLGRISFSKGFRVGHLSKSPCFRTAAQSARNPLALTDRLMFSLARALPDEMRGVYAEVPRGFEM